MGKVVYKELSEDHPIFKAGWKIATRNHQSQKIKSYEKNKVDKNKK